MTHYTSTIRNLKAFFGLSPLVSPPVAPSHRRGFTSFILGQPAPVVVYTHETSSKWSVALRLLKYFGITCLLLLVLIPVAFVLILRYRAAKVLNFVLQRVIGYKQDLDLPELVAQILGLPQVFQSYGVAGVLQVLSNECFGKVLDILEDKFSSNPVVLQVVNLVRATGSYLRGLGSHEVIADCLPKLTDALGADDIYVRIPELREAICRAFLVRGIEPIKPLILNIFTYLNDFRDINIFGFLVSILSILFKVSEYNDIKYLGRSILPEAELDADKTLKPE